MNGSRNGSKNGLKITYCAGGIVWRESTRGREVLLILSRKNQDWKFPKGHIDDDDDGWDAAAKTAALANVLMDADLTPHRIERAGITALSPSDLRHAISRGRRIRLVASARIEGGEVHGRVAPAQLDAGDPLATLTGTQNALVLETDILGDVGIFQLTGGLTQTAYALIADLVAVRDRVAGGPAGSGI